MSLDSLVYPTVFLLMITSLGILLIHEWRWAIIFLVLQYLGVFILVSVSWSHYLSLAKLIAGVVAGAVLWTAQVNRISEERESEGGDNGTFQSTFALGVSGRIFRFFAAAMVWLVVFSVTPVVHTWLPAIQIEQVWGGFILIGLGLLHLGLIARPFWVVIGLLTVLSGFEIIYASVEVSALVQGLLAGVTLGISLAGAYLILAPTMETAE